MTITVLLADDQPLVRAGFAYFIDTAPDMALVGQATDGAEAVALARATTPDVVVMDIRMPGLDGLAATAHLSADPALAGTRVLILTTFELDEYVFTALRAGAAGFLGKSAEPADLLQAIRTVHRGESLLSPAAVKALISRFLAQPEHSRPAAADRLTALTEREREVVALVASGMNNDEIAAHLVLSPHTAKTHVNRAMTKLGARDRAQLVITAYETGLASAPQQSQ
ncbi:DNA-binding response regulator [Catellatospora sp. IY07-71]|uniref:response regulator transcription factor n=1 Tax=Catellatospora sp. IY07-71 TaxID=2728827 RepID=UPI001BB372E9|nr:response regulator transcription factor [Catellatospora sp. IY07-71]BCJ76369.1 DNA-binding response regulator [Catellatospora sp. IY07-71]